MVTLIDLENCWTQQLKAMSRNALLSLATCSRRSHFSCDIKCHTRTRFSAPCVALQRVGNVASPDMTLTNYSRDFVAGLGNAVHQSRPEEHRHRVPPDGRAGAGGELPGADQRPAGVRRDPRPVPRRRGREHHLRLEERSQGRRPAGHARKLLELLHRASAQESQGKRTGSVDCGNRFW